MFFGRVIFLNRVILNALISKQGLRDKDGFFSIFFFLFTLRKKFSWGTNYGYRRTFFFILFFFLTCHGKVILVLKRDMSKFSNIFSHEKPKTFRLKKNETQKKNKVLNEKKKYSDRISSILLILENTKAWKYSINRFCGQKRRIKLNSCQYCFFCPQNLLMLYFHAFVF